jgi:hypothetical protein
MNSKQAACLLTKARLDQCATYNSGKRVREQRVELTPPYDWELLGARCQHNMYNPSITKQCGMTSAPHTCP